MNIKKVLLIALLLVALAAAYVWFFVYNKPFKDIEDAKADFKTTSTELAKEFDAGHDAAQAKYVNKVVEISGPIDSVIKGDSLCSIVFKPSEKYLVICELYTKYNDEAMRLKPKDEVVLKGEFENAGKPEEMIGEYIAGDIRLRKSSFNKK